MPLEKGAKYETKTPSTPKLTPLSGIETGNALEEIDNRMSGVNFFPACNKDVKKIPRLIFDLKLRSGSYL